MDNETRSKHFTLQQIAEGVFAAIAEEGGAGISNAGLVDLGGQVIVFDTFLTPQAARGLRQKAEELSGGAPLVVVNSHYHNDHMWGNQAFAPETQIISSARTRQLIQEAGMEELQWYAANSARQLESYQAQTEQAQDEEARRALKIWVGYYAGLVEALPTLSVRLPNLTFTGRLELHGSKRSAELMPFEGGHTGSDTVLYLPQDGIVFMSDLLFTGCHPYLADGDPDQLLKALNEVGKLGARRFVPGHGPVGTEEDLRLMVAYVEYCLETAKGLVREGKDSEEGVEMDERFKDWKMANFIEANMRFLCKYLNPARED